MEKIIIDTGLENFIMPDKITKITETSIDAVKTVNREPLPLFQKIETLAQICALHTRYRTEFQRHAFLLKINTFKEGSGENTTGSYRIRANLTGNGKSAFSYSVSAGVHGRKMYTADLIIAVSDYDEAFKAKELSEHYRSIFSCLMTNT